MLSKPLQEHRQRRRAPSRPRLLLVSPLPPPAGGVATWTRHLLESQLPDRYEVRVINTNTGRATGQASGVDGRKLALSARFLRRFLRELALYRPDVVHINTSMFLPLLSMDGLFAALARRTGAVTALHLRGSVDDALERTRPELRGLQRALLATADHRLALHLSGVDRLRELDLEADLIPNFVVQRDAPERDARTGPVRILFVGWLFERKGIVDLLQAVARIRDVELVLLGRFVHEGRAGVEPLLASPQLRGRVALPGEVPLEQVWQWYASSDIFALPSWNEGFPNTLVESMMMGLPAVVTPVGAMPEIVLDGQTGLVVPVRDVDALAQALTRLVEDRALRLAMGRAARQRALQHYERDRVLADLTDRYDRWLGRA